MIKDDRSKDACNVLEWSLRKTLNDKDISLRINDGDYTANSRHYALKHNSYRLADKNLLN